MGLFVAYSLPPFELNYRGGGELLEMLGVGIALPLFNAYLQSGSVSGWPVLLGFSCLGLASAIASGLSDEESDRLGGKRTVTSTLGNAWARRLTEGAVLGGITVWLVTAAVRPEILPFWTLIIPLLVVFWNFLGMRAVSDRAVTNAFVAQRAYKRYLHSAVWHGGAWLAMMLFIRGVA